MPKQTPELEYPIASTVLIDYIKNTAVYPVFIGIDFISFSTEPYLGGSRLPSHVDVPRNGGLNRDETADILLRLNLRPDDFEEFAKSVL